MDRFWFLTWTTYGTWLIGDERGFVGNIAGPDGKGIRLNLPGTEYAADLPALQRYMHDKLKCPPIWLSGEHAGLLLPQFRETATYRGWTLFAAAVMANHADIVVAVPGDPDPSDILGDFKSYGSRRLNRQWGKPASGTWWSEGGSKRKLPDERAVWGAIRYVRDQTNPLAVWLNAGAIREHLDPSHAEELLASGGREPPVDDLNRGLTPPARQCRYIEAPEEYDGPGASLFLAGGITGTFDWQADVVRRLGDLPLVLLNPRRANFPMNDPTAAETQIAWEFRHIRRATAVLFWFPLETLCPIALFELGSRVMVPEQLLFVGTHPEYGRRLDVEIQLRLARSEVQLASDTGTLADQVREWFTRRSQA